MKGEVLSGPERYRRRREEEKATIIAETLVPGARVAEVAQRRGVGRSLIYTWRRAHGHRLGERGAVLDLVPVVVAEGVPAAAAPHGTAGRSGSIEIALPSGIRVMVPDLSLSSVKNAD